ncbi:serine/threonine-protein kinase [Hahella ganghwensis]|uniref:serine/threonine-protein kinase n=1 Tax=Hahella ganghwensis TaxID=286420 RepID=UPI00047806A5|nr:serine/threonine-protein kinase [Hahella ganghwensis]
MADSRKTGLSVLLGRLWRWYSIRTLVLLCACLLVFLPTRPPSLQALDIQLFETAQSLTPIAAVRTSKHISPDQSPWWTGVIEGYRSGTEAIPQDLSVPYWLPLAERVAILLMAVYLLLGLSRMGLAAGFWLTFLILAGITTTELGMLALQGKWWPLGSAIQFLAVGYLLMLFWLRPHQEIQVLQTNQHDLGLKLAGQFYQQQRLDQAMEALEFCYATDEALELCYSIAIEQEKKRQYTAAINTYEAILEQTGSFRDVKERLQSLRAANSVLTQHATGLEMASTLAIPEASVKPVLGRYEIQQELGRGAMGIVYLGKDPKIARLVAIKTLNYQQFDSQELDELRERFFREAEAAGRLSHPNIVAVYDVGEEVDLAYIAMDYVQGCALDRYCRADELLPVAKVYELMAQVADALQYAHERNVIHRDIKPSNLLYNPETGQVKVSDFGIARISDDSKTRTGLMLGSPLYMSPEQLKGKAIKATADLYSLSVTFYQLLTGATPFKADTLPELSIQILNKKHKSVRELREDLPASAVRIINKGLQKEPSKRFQNAGEMAAAIREALVSDFGREVA